MAGCGEADSVEGRKGSGGRLWWMYFFFFCLRLEAQVFFIHILQDTQLKTYCAVYKINIHLTNVDER